MKRIVVTGGSGFIGTNLIESLIKEGYDVINIDKSEPCNKQHYDCWNQVDILDYSKLEKAIIDFKPELIVHLAAVTDLNGKDFAYYDTNITGTKNIIRIASCTPSLRKILFTSSMYVCQPGFIPKDYDTYRPHTVYGESKVKGELLVKEIKGDAFDWVIIRPTSIWGPWFKQPYIDFFDIVYKGKYFDFGKACTKTYGFVDNTIYQIRKLIEADKVHSKTFYLGDYYPVQISEWANEISQEMGKGKIKEVPFQLLKVVALTGDILSKLNIKFPMTSFRLKNMTTDNILPLDNLYDITGELPFSRIDGVRKTINWLTEHKNYQVNN